VTPGAWWRAWPGRSRSLLARLGALSARPDRLAAVLFEQPGVGLVAIDRGGAIVRANAAMRALAGPAADLRAGAPVAALFAEGDRDAALAEIAFCLRGQPARPAVAIALAAGATVGVAALGLREADGRVGGALLRLSDLSAQRELEAQLAQAQKLQAVGQLAGGIAHDFNNLLTAVLGAAESAAGRGELPAELAEDLAQIRASARRGADLVRQLLAFGRQQTLQPRVLALNAVVSEISGLLRRLLGSRIRLDLELEEPGGQVRADPTQLDQVLVNLAVNARDAMPDGGRLLLRTGHLTLLRARGGGAEAVPPGRYVMVEVADSGCGIAPDILPRIFDPFFTTRRERGGTGLGLSTVHGIVRQSEGFLEVESRLGEGTTLRVFLPRTDDRAMSIPPPPPAPPPAPPPPPRAAAAGPVARGKILLVDDEAPVRRLAERALLAAGWSVVAVAGGEEAVRALDAAPGAWAALVTDIAMPGMDGVQVARAVRARTGQPGLPVLMMSGYAEAALRQSLAGEIRVAFLAKPYAPGELAASLASLLEAAGEMPANLSVANTHTTNI
jgi:two-component system cell cycle sensor histidine kinase/response regulator CckA